MSSSRNQSNYNMEEQKDSAISNIFNHIMRQSQFSESMNNSGKGEHEEYDF